MNGKTVRATPTVAPAARSDRRDFDRAVGPPSERTRWPVRTSPTATPATTAYPGPMTVRPPMSSARRRRGRDRRVPRYRFLCRRRLSSLARRVRRRPGQCSGSSTPRLDARFHRTRVRPLRSRFVTSRRLARRATNDPTARRTAPAGRRSPSRLAPCATGDVRSCAAAGPRLLDSLRPPFRSFDRTAADSSVRRRPSSGSVSSSDGVSAACKRSGRES